MSTRETDLYRAATMYYLQSETMESVAQQLGVSRSTVSRLLQEARQQGVVEIRVHPPGRDVPVAQLVERRFGVRCHCAPVRRGASEIGRIERVASLAATLLSQEISGGDVLGIAWGVTTATMIEHLPRTPVQEVRVVQINGAASHRTSGLPHAQAIVSRAAEAFGGESVLFPVPAFFDRPETKQAMWQERSVRRVLDLQAEMDLAVFGVGSLRGPVTSHVYANGYLSTDEMRELRLAGVVGDVCTVFLREDGSWNDIELNHRATGLNPAQLARIPRRIAVVAGAAKVAPLLGALRAGAVTDLVVDEPAAHALLHRDEATRTSG